MLWRTRCLRRVSAATVAGQADNLPLPTPLLVSGGWALLCSKAAAGHPATSRFAQLPRPSLAMQTGSATCGATASSSRAGPLASVPCAAAASAMELVSPSDRATPPPEVGRTRRARCGSVRRRQAAQQRSLQGARRLKERCLSRSQRDRQDVPRGARSRLPAAAAPHASAGGAAAAPGALARVRHRTASGPKPRSEARVGRQAITQRLRQHKVYSACYWSVLGSREARLESSVKGAVQCTMAQACVAGDKSSVQKAGENT